MAVKINCSNNLAKSNSISTKSKTNKSSSNKKNNTSIKTIVTCKSSNSSKSTVSNKTNSKSNLSNKCNIQASLSQKLQSSLTSNITKNTTYLTDAPKIYTSSKTANTYQRDTGSYASSKLTSNTNQSNIQNTPHITKVYTNKVACTTNITNSISSFMSNSSNEISAKCLNTKKSLSKTDTAKEIASFTISCIPVVGDVKDLTEAIMGKDLITNKKLSNEERISSAASTILPGSASKTGKAVKKIGNSKITKKFTQKTSAKINITKKSIKKAIRKKITLQSIIKNGKISISDIKANPSIFNGKSANEIAIALKISGYNVTIKTSTRSRSGAQIIKINNPGNGKNISQVQVSPGGGRHGDSPYVKISTTAQGIIKIINGSKSQYKTDGKETATIIFSGGK